MNPHPIPPASTFHASPTYNAWVPLTAADIHALRPSPAHANPGILFHLNHPVRYVRAVGALVSLERIHSALHVLTLDDGSGATLDVRLAHDPVPAAAAAAEGTFATRVPGLTLCADGVALGGQVLAPGAVLKAKGSLSRFRGALQLDLLRLARVESAAEEVRAWEAHAAFFAAVLARPWVLSGEEVGRLEEEGMRRAREGRAKAAERARREGKRRRAEERAERRSRREAPALDGNALDRVGAG